MSQRSTSPRSGAVELLLLALVAAGTLVVGPRPERCPEGPGCPPPGGEASGEDAMAFTPDALQVVLEPVRDEVARGATPGAAVAVGVRDREAHLVGVGRVGWRERAAEVDPGTTLYDLASLTKVLATASAVMLLVDDGRMRLDDPVSLHLPTFVGGGKERVTIRHLLSHRSGLPPTGPVRGGGTRAQLIRRLIGAPINFEPGSAREYSDAGYVVLWEAAERAAGEPLPVYLERRLYGPLGMTRTRFSPGLACEACAPTSRLRDGDLYRGKPFDPLAQKLDGVSGNAGLFSTARDVARFAAMVTSGGELDGVRVLREETVREFTRIPVGPGESMLGWQTFCVVLSGEGEECDRPSAYGHNGWTGTSLWIDPGTGRWVVLLTNRTFEPRASSALREVRREIFARALAAGSETGTDHPGPE